MRSILSRIPQAKDLSISILLFMVILLMILPMPTVVVDGLIGLNFGIAILLLMTGIYLATPLSLSSLPGIILISTIFRLSLSITTTRLILAEGDAGSIVETFGSIVVAGNVVVGMVVFFIITIVQFIVIAKGAERIAEVGARFTLDALPGKQMAIDAELRNGDIDNVEAGQRRRHLERESQFFGAMDGAMKFVKGDAIAGLIIILVNLIGGLIIGVAQLGMPFGEAAAKYSLLTVGDALISQIPALLMSITAAIIVTRVRGEEQRNLGADIISQVSSDLRALRLAGVALIIMGVLPGFPTILLVALGLIFIAASYADAIKARVFGAEKLDQNDQPETYELESNELPPTDESQVVLQLSAELFALYSTTDLISKLDQLASNVSQRTGLQACSITAEKVENLDPDQFRLMIDSSPTLWSTSQKDQLILDDVSDVLKTYGIPYRGVKTALWLHKLEVSEEFTDKLTELGLTFLHQEEWVMEQSEDCLVQNISSLIGLQETRDILAAMEESYPVLIAELMKLLSIQKVTEVFRRLLEEKVPLSNKRKILEALVEWAPTDTTGLALTEYCRMALKQQLCEIVAGKSRAISAIVIERDTEDILRSTLRETNIGTYLVLSEDQSAAFLSLIREQIAILSPKQMEPVILTSMDIRRHVKVFLTRNSVDITVLSFQELSDDYTVVPCSTLSLRTIKNRFRDEIVSENAELEGSSISEE